MKPWARVRWFYNSKVRFYESQHCLDKCVLISVTAQRHSDGKNLWKTQRNLVRITVRSHPIKVNSGL